MRILHLTQYFPPEPGAVQVRAEAMARYLTKSGHQVTVLTEMPNHPIGIIYPDYRGKFYLREIYQGLDVARVWVKTSSDKNYRTRLIFYTSYMLNAILRGLFLTGNYDVIYANSPPLPVGIAAASLGILRRTPFVFEIQDLWPESAIEMGELTNQRAIRWATSLEEWCYNRANRIVVVSEGIGERIKERGISKEKIVMIENGSNTDLFNPQPEAGRQLREQWNLQEKFIVFYGGIIGIAQGLEIIVETARLMKDYPDIQFVIVGEGPRRAALEQLISEYNLQNIKFLPGQPLDSMAEYISSANVTLAPLRDLPIFERVRPTKILDSWACAKPVIVSARGEPCRIVETANGGLCTEPENPDKLANEILFMRDNPDKCNEFANKGRGYVHNHYSLKAMAQKLENLLQSCVAK